MINRRTSFCFLITACISVIYIVLLHYPRNEKRSNSFTSIMKDDDIVGMARQFQQNISTRSSRLPDIIGIGTEKCGSGALQFYLMKHPLIRISQMKETHFFTRYCHEENMDLEYYKSLLPNATDEEYIMEKTPAYFNFFPTRNIPRRIKDNVPWAKIWVVLCDPTNRVFSDFVHEKNMKQLPRDLDFRAYMEPRLNELQRDLTPLVDDDNTTAIYLKEHMRRPYLSHMYLTGMYYYHLKQWFEYYNKRNLIIVDGEKLIENPFEEVSKVEKFMSLPSFFKREHFVLNETTGFYCVHVDESLKSDGSPPCLGGRKGNTRKKPEMWEDYKDTLDKIRQFYKPYNDKLFKMLNRTFDW